MCIRDRASGQDPGALLVFAAILGFGGSLISLAMSKFIASRSVGARVISEPRTAEEAWLVATVRQLAQKAGIGMPEVAIFDSPQPNAFATGARRDAALVAVSTGLLQRMQRNEVELRKVLPNFNARQLMGQNIDLFHKNPAHQRSMLSSLRTNYKTQIKVGSLHFGLSALSLIHI